MLLKAVQRIRVQVRTMAEFKERVVLSSIDVDAVFEMLQNTTPFFRNHSNTSDDIVTQCPFHGNGNERHPSFGICNNRSNPSYGLYHCFTCGESGNIIQLINKLHNVDDANDTTLVQQMSDVAFTDVRGAVILKPREPAKKPVVTDVELKSYRVKHVDYLDNRGVAPLIQQAFDCGYDEVQDAVTFPVKHLDGSVYFIVRRKIKYKQYHYPLGVDKPIYGLFEFYTMFPNRREIVIVESIINALTLWGWGIPAVALLGTGSQTQIDFLNTTEFRKYIICLDGDAAGYKGTEKLRKKLHAYTTSVPMLPGKDVNDLDKNTFMTLYALRH